MATDVEDDEPETQPCYRHPTRETALACSTCDRPICTDCAIPAAVGIKCPECAKQPKAARAATPTNKLISGIAAGTFVAFAGGTAISFVPFLHIILAYFLGRFVVDATRAGSGGFRDPFLNRFAIIISAVGAIGWQVLMIVGNLSDISGRDATFIIFTLIAGAAAAFGASNRAND